MYGICIDQTQVKIPEKHKKTMPLTNEELHSNSYLNQNSIHPVT